MIERELFIAALQKGDPVQRQAYLDEACGGQPELREQVENLLGLHAGEGSFLEQPAAESAATLGQPILERPGTQIGPYKLMEQIGEGGMGLVFVAEQHEPVRRKVALKVIKPGMDTRDVIARFEAERQALALMDHPHIARVLDAGATASGRPYFVMELVKGVPITQYCDDNRLSPRERLELFTYVCHAVQHAHQKGIIHRDIKPTNVMVTSHDGHPVVKVIDFGVAKAVGQRLTERTLYTAITQMVGTPLYMSPEQAGTSGLDIDTRSDIYSLGVLLYELLTGTTPFDKERLKQAAYEEMRRIIREEEPQKPSTRISELSRVGRVGESHQSAEAALRDGGTRGLVPPDKSSLASIAAQRHTEPAKLARLVRGDLDWIVMKALEKDRSRRYETANGFAADVLHYLADEPVLACPPSASYRFRKFARRNKVALATTTVIAAVLVLGTVVSTWQAVRATRAEALAQTRLESETQALKQAKSNYDLAEERRKTAQAQQRAAEEARKEAIANLAQARAAVDQMLTRVSEEKLLNVPQMEQLRRDLLEDALKFYQQFLRENSEDRAVRFGTGEAYRRTGIIYTQLGQPDQAERAHQAAVTLLEKLAGESPTERSYRESLALSYHLLGAALVQLARYADSVPAYERAIGLVQEMAAEAPTHPVYPRWQATFERDLSAVLQRIGRLETQAETEQSLREALQLLQTLLADAPDNPRLRDAVAHRQKLLGRFLEGRQPQQAEELYRDAIATDTDLASDFPHTTAYRAELADTCLHLFWLLVAGRRFEEAEEVYRQSLPHAEKVFAEASHRGFHGRLLGDHYWLYAQMLLKTGRPKDAEQTMRQALALAEKLSIAFPTEPMIGSRLVAIHGWLGDLHRSDSRFAEAEAAYRQALKQSEQCVRDFPEMSQMRDQLGNARVCLGRFLTARGRSEEAADLDRRN